MGEALASHEFPQKATLRPLLRISHETLEGIRQEEIFSVSRLWEVIGLSRATYCQSKKKGDKRHMRRGPGRGDIMGRGSWHRDIRHGHRKAWALVRKEGLRG